MKEASKEYSKVCKNISLLFEALKLLYAIQPSYFFNWSTMKRLLLSKIEKFMQDKGAIGAARAKQVEAFCLTTFYDYLSSSLIDRHFKLLLFFHSILILIESSETTLAIEQKQDKKHHHHHKSHSISSSASPDSPSQRAWRLFSLALRPNDLQDTIFMSLSNDQNPDYLDANSWANFKALEAYEPNGFKNLCKSLREETLKWREYFWPQQPSRDLIDKDVDLLNETPLGNKMGFIEKLALWFCARPEKVFNTLKF